MDIIVTLPQRIEWADYQRELDAVADGGGVLNYRLPGPPGTPGGGLVVSALKGTAGEDARCYLVWRRAVRGWMEIVGVRHYSRGFTCQTTGKFWPPGVYIQRSGPFHRIEPMPMRGFQGWRYAPKEWREEA